MSKRLMRIGNINDLPAATRGRLGIGKGLGLGQRMRALTTKALDKGQALVSREIDFAFGDDGSEEEPLPARRGAAPLESQLSEEQAEVALAGLGQALDAIGGLRTPAARRIQHRIEGIITDIAGELDQTDGADGLMGGGVDVIGLDGASAGGLAGYSADEWR